MKPTRYRGIKEVEQGLYQIRARGIDPKTGRERQVTHLMRVPLREAVELQAKWRREIEEGTRDGAGRVRLADYARSWLTTKAPLIKPSTRAKYATSLDLHILPALGDVYLDALKPFDVQKWVADQQAKQRAGWSVINDLRCLRTVCRDAMADLDLPRDPCARVRGPRGQEYTDEQPNRLTAPELAKLIGALRQHEPEWLAFVMTIGFTGLRFGEASALMWSDVDWDAGLIRVRRSNWKGKVTGTKTHKDRSVPLVGELAAILREHHERQVAAGHPGLRAGWIFPTREGTLYKGSVLVPVLKRALPKAEIERRLTAHGLRRTFNDLARKVTSGEVVRGIMGHSTEAMTQHYSHIAADEKIAAGASVVRLVFGGPQKNGEPSGEPPAGADPAAPNSSTISGGAARI